MIKLEQPGTESPYLAFRRGVEELAAKMPIANPTPEMIVTLAPYMELAAAQYVLNESKKLGRLRFAGPALYTRGVYHTYGLDWQGGNCRLHRVCCYAREGVDSYTGPDKIWHEEALNFSDRQSLPGDLLPGTHPTTAVVELIDIPCKPSAVYFKFTVALTQTIRGFTTTGLPDFKDDNSEPLSELLDDLFLVAVPPGMATDELTAGRATSWLHFCARCGGGINAEGCMACDRRGATNNRRSWPSAISRRMAEAAKKLGHKFEIDPHLIRIREHLRWAQQQLRGRVSAEEHDYKAPRMLDVGDTHAVGAVEG